MTRRPHARAAALRWSMLGLACTGLTACSSLSDSLTPSKVDYRAVATASANKPQALDVPPDLTQLSSDPRYAPPAGSAISANALRQAGPAATAPVAGTAAVTASPLVAQTASGDLRIVREGDTRWLVSSRTPEELWPQLRQFWLDAGFTLDKDEPALGYMETGWAENRAKLPTDILRRTLGRLVDGLYDTGDRDRYRTRVERSAQGTEITISHRGAMEVATGRENEQTRWQMRPSDPALEAEMLARMMAKLAPQPAPDAQSAAAPAASAASQAVAQASAPAARARVLDGRAASTVQIDDGFDRAWRRVGLALDRGGFTVEDRDRNQGLYFVRYVDPKLAGEEDPNFFQRLFGKRKDELAGTRLRLKIVSSQGGQVSLLETLDVEGNARNDALTRGIVQLLAQEMR